MISFEKMSISAITSTEYEIPYLVQLENSYLLMLVTNTFVKKIHHQVTQL